MTKTLTEQWREGTLPQGWYYVKTPCGEIKKLYCGDGESLELDDPETAGYYFFHRNLNKGQVEVLATVPSYEELREKEVIYNTTSRCNETLLGENESLKNKVGKLKEQLKIATKALKEISQHYSPEYNRGGEISHKALKEMEGVK